MWFNKRRSSSAHGTKCGELERVSADVVHRGNLREHVDDAEIEDQHADLEPETGERPELLRMLQAAKREAARHEGGADSSPSSFDTALDEDLGFLRSAMTDYDVLERIRYGGQGVVYRAYHQKTKRTVAIKVLLDGPLATVRQLARFEREAELTSRLRHPNIVTLYDYGAVRGRLYLTMQCVDGLPMDDYVVLHDLPPRETVALFATVCRAVGHAHQNGIIHRDLNPANILVDASGQPYVLDFGLAKDLWAGKDSGACSTTGQVVGTLPYLSPEQVEGVDGGVDVRSDVYSLGVALFELLTDVMPYPVDGGPQRVRSAILSTEALPLRKAAALGNRDRLPGPDSMNHDLEMVLRKALAKDKAERYQSATAFADDLERFLAGEAVEAKAGNRFYLLRKTLRRYRLVATVGALFLLILTISSVVVSVSLVQARVQRSSARAIAHVAHSALNDMVTEFEEAIRPLAGGTDVRDRVLNRVAGHLALLRPLVEFDAAMKDLLTMLREKQGDIAYAEGRHSEAAEHYAASLEAVPAQTGTESRAVEDLAHAARVHRKLAAVSEDREAHFKHAIEIGEKLLHDQPNANDVRYELCRARIELALHFYDAGRYGLEAEQIDAALALAQPTDVPGTDGMRRSDLLATAYAMRGNVDVRLGHRESARQRLEAALSVRQRLVRERPADVSLRHKLLASCMGLGCLHRDDGRRSEAAELFRKAVEVGEYLTTVDPAVALWTRDLYAAHDHLARLLLEDGELDEAQGHCDAAMRLATSLSETEPSNADWQRTLGFSHKLRGQVYSARSQWQLAQESFEQARAVHTALCTREPENLEFQADLAEIHDWLGKCCRNLGHSESALAHYEKAYDIRKALLADQPDVASRVVDVVLSQTKLATWHLDQHTPEGDQAAARLLGLAEASLLSLDCAGRLSTRAGKYRNWLDAIHANKSLIAQREAARTRADQISVAQPPEP